MHALLPFFRGVESVPYRWPLGSYSPVGRGGIISLVSLQLAAGQIVPAMQIIRPVKLAYQKLTHYKKIQTVPLLDGV
jgi:hypothetical protein